MPTFPKGKRLAFQLTRQPSVQLDFFDAMGAVRKARPRGPLIKRLPAALWFPDLAGAARSADAKVIGLSGEHLVMSEVTRHGFEACLVPERFGHDIRVNHSRLSWRIQVKAVTFPKNGYYTVVLQKGCHSSAQGRRDYDPDEFDMVAIAILPRNVVIFTRQSGPTIRISEAEVRFASENPGNSFLTAIGELLADPHAGHVPDREKLGVAFHAEWRRRLQRKMKAEAETMGNTVLPPSCLPSESDDQIEGTLTDGTIVTARSAVLPTEGVGTVTPSEAARKAKDESG